MAKSCDHVVHFASFNSWHAQFDAIWLAVMDTLRAIFPPDERENAMRVPPQALSGAYVTKMVKVPHPKAVVSSGMCRSVGLPGVASNVISWLQL
jgi:hypothetical protein